MLDCWARYAGNASNGAVTEVSVSFVVPTINCSKSSSTVTLIVEIDGTPDSLDSAWTGIYDTCTGTSTPTLAAVFFDSPSRGSATPWNANSGGHVYFSITEAARSLSSYVW